MLERSIYEDIPHLLTPVVTDPKKAVFALKWVVREMENRYKLMSSVSVKNISSYNNKVLNTISSGRKLYREVQTGIDSDTRIPIIEKQEIKLEKMPFIVVVIDEMADLMMVAGKEVETLVQRLAQMARASGIHLITATQRPSVDVITGTIKANFPSRISYKVASKFDSRTILNEMGAEQLLGSGDMLFLENGGNIKRLHGGFVSESEVEKVVNSIKKQATFDYKKEISLENIENVNNTNDDLVSNNNDELYSKAVEIVIKQQKVSTSYIQRYLQIGYNRAARIIEKMEDDGIISEANNAGKRHVLKKQ
jgi:S-DNA-T family DNA segregation ATPase FtsK/SpoIIIE